MKTGGVFRFYNYDEKKYPDLKEFLNKEKPVYTKENQILQNGLSFAMPYFHDKINSLVFGNQINPTPSTFTTIQEIESLITGISCPRVGFLGTSILTDGVMLSYMFKRPRASGAGIQITECGVVVSEANKNVLFARIVADPDQILHEFSTQYDTIVVYDVIIRV